MLRFIRLRSLALSAALSLAGASLALAQPNPGRGTTAPGGVEPGAIEPGATAPETGDVHHVPTPAVPPTPGLSTLELADPAAPLSLIWNNEARSGRPSDFQSRSANSWPLVVFRSGRQIYAFADVEPESTGAGAVQLGVWFASETDQNLAMDLAAAAAAHGFTLPPAFAEQSAALFRAPYRWTALCIDATSIVELLNPPEGG